MKMHFGKKLSSLYILWEVLKILYDNLKPFKVWQVWWAVMSSENINQTTSAIIAQCQVFIEKGL